jgi:hypothetical protein
LPPRTFFFYFLLQMRLLAPPPLRRHEFSPNLKMWCGTCSPSGRDTPPSCRHSTCAHEKKERIGARELYFPQYFRRSRFFAPGCSTVRSTVALGGASRRGGLFFLFQNFFFLMTGCISSLARLYKMNGSLVFFFPKEKRGKPCLTSGCS